MFIRRRSIAVGIAGLSQHGKSVLMKKFVQDTHRAYPHITWSLWNGGEGQNQWTQFDSTLNPPRQLCYVLDDIGDEDGETYDLTDYYESQRPFLIIGGITPERQAPMSDEEYIDYTKRSFEFFGSVTKRISPCVAVVDEVDEWCEGDLWIHPFLHRVVERGAHIMGEREYITMDGKREIETIGVSLVFLFRLTQDLHKRLLNKKQHMGMVKMGSQNRQHIKRYIIDDKVVVEKIINLKRPIVHGPDDVTIDYLWISHDRLLDDDEKDSFTVEFY